MLALTLTILISSCDQHELKDTRQQNDSLIEVLNKRDVEITELMGYFDDLEHNLDSIAFKQQILSCDLVQYKKLSTGKKMQINTVLEDLNILMNQNRMKISELNRKFKKIAQKNIIFKKIITAINNQQTQKEIELFILNKKINTLSPEMIALEIFLDTIALKNKIQTEINIENNILQHTAFYIVGKSKDLRKAKIIDKEDAFLGIGKTTELFPDIDNRNFTRIDYEKTTIIPINNNAIKLVTEHPRNSYTLAKNKSGTEIVTSIIIINPEKFWSNSKYLIVIKS